MGDPPAASLFISDLHLTAARPDITARFHNFLERHSTGCKALYILGDLFDAWVGDDDLADPLHAEIASALLRATQGGLAIHLMHGNRDFLLGERFCRASGARPLPDPSVIVLGGNRTLLSHGDALCTDDIDYQSFRRMVRDPAWQAGFLEKPLAERHAIARELRARSERVKGEKRPEIMDVNPQAVEEAFRRHRVVLIIHGHTHRPAHHASRVDDLDRERWVLPDWYDMGGGILCEGADCRSISP